MAQATNSAETHEQVKHYYGQTLGSNRDLRTQACCTAEAMPAHVRSILAELEEEITDKFYGCGSPIPLELDGRTVLDLGCGAGKICYIASQIVGSRGRVIGVDCNDDMLAFLDDLRSKVEEVREGGDGGGGGGGSGVSDSNEGEA